MGKISGIILLATGITGVLYSWVSAQRKRLFYLEEVILFVQKSIYVIQDNRIRIIRWFLSYESRSEKLENSLKRVGEELSANRYPDGATVWTMVMEEGRDMWGRDKETMELLLSLGTGFFGYSAEENVEYLRRCRTQLEKRKEDLNKQMAQEQRVWVPVGMLSGIMLIIILI